MSLRTFFLLFVCLLGSTTVFASTEFGKSLARQGVGSAANTLGTLDAEKELGVSVSGGLGGGGRKVNVDYSQVLTGQIECPTTVGETGKYSNLQQFVAACEAETGISNRLWVCVPFDQNDTMTSDCEDGQWKTISVPKNDTGWKIIGSGITAKIDSCTGEDCEYRLKISKDFKGGEVEATIEGEAQAANSKGAAELIKNQGAYLPNGTVLQPGTNPNSGDIVGAMMASGSIAACADDVKVSIENGTPVFTCDGNQDVGVVGDGEGCEEVTQCDNWETEENEYTKKCEVSIDYEDASCEVEYETKTCQIENAKTREKCTTDVSTSHVATLPTLKACFSITKPYVPYFNYSFNLPDHFKDQNVFVGLSFFRQGYSAYKGVSTVTTLNGKTMRLRSLYYSGLQAQIYNGSRKLAQFNINKGTNPSIVLDVCIKENNPKLEFYRSNGFCWSNCSAYSDDLTNGKFVPKSIYLNPPDNSQYYVPGPSLKAKYIDQGYGMYKSLDTSSYPFAENHIIYIKENSQVCELTND